MDGSFNLRNFPQAMKLYEQIRIPRSGEILDCSKKLGVMQGRRCHAETVGLEDIILQGEVMLDDTVAVLFSGASHHYEEAVDAAIAEFEGRTIKGVSITEEEAENYMMAMGT